MNRKMFAKRTLPMALAAVLTVAPVQALAANDLSGHWAEKVITQWQDAGLIKGYADGSFKPNNHATRAEFVVMMNNALGFEDAEDIAFGDVKAGDWYYNAVAKAVAAGYSKGYADGTFKPSATITRAEAAVMIANAAGLEADETGAEGFTDAYAIPGWAKGSIGAAVNAGFMSGYTDGSFGAAKSITRAEAVSSLNRVMGGAAVEEEVVVAEDVVVTEDDAVVENRTVNGNVVIDEAVGSGEVYLNDVVIEGDLIVNGGGDDSIYLKNVHVKGKIKVNKKGVRVQFSGATKAPEVEVNALSNITAKDFEGEVGTITIVGDLGTGTRVTIDVPADAVVIEGQSSVAINADVKNVTIGEDAAGAKLEVGKNATVETVTADAKAAITGTGKVETLEANASGITVNKGLSVNSTETASGVTKPSTTGTTSGGGSSSSGGSHTPSTPEATVTKADVEALTAKAKALTEGVVTSTDGKDLTDGTKWATGEAKAALDKAISDAEALFDETEPTAEQLKAAKAALETAMANFKPATVDLTATKEALAGAITEAADRNAAVIESADGKYNGEEIEQTKEWATEGAKSALTDAIGVAEGAKDAEGVTENSLTAAKTALEFALAKFETQAAWGIAGAKKLGDMRSSGPDGVRVVKNEELLTVEDVIQAYPGRFPVEWEFSAEEKAGEGRFPGRVKIESTWICETYNPEQTGRYDFEAIYKIPQGYRASDHGKDRIMAIVTLDVPQKPTVTAISAVVKEGTTFELNGTAPKAEDFVVTATLSKGEPATKTLDASEYTVDITGVDMNTAGTYPVTIILTEDQTKTAAAKVEVVDPAAGAKKALKDLEIPTELTVGVAAGDVVTEEIVEAAIKDALDELVAEGYTVTVAGTYTEATVEPEAPAKWVGKVTVTGKDNAKNTATSDEAKTITITIEKAAAVTSVAVDKSLVVKGAEDTVTVTVGGTDLTTDVKVALSAEAPAAGTAVTLAGGSKEEATAELSTKELAVGTYYVWYTVDGENWKKYEALNDVTVEVRPSAEDIDLDKINLDEIKVEPDDTEEYVEAEIAGAVMHALSGTEFVLFTVTATTAENGYNAPTAEVDGSWVGTIKIADNKEVEGTFVNNINFEVADGIVVKLVEADEPPVVEQAAVTGVALNSDTVVGTASVAAAVKGTALDGVTLLLSTAETAEAVEASNIKAEANVEASEEGGRATFETANLPIGTYYVYWTTDSKEYFAVTENAVSFSVVASNGVTGTLSSIIEDLKEGITVNKESVEKTDVEAAVYALPSISSLQDAPVLLYDITVVAEEVVDSTDEWKVTITVTKFTTSADTATEIVTVTVTTAPAGGEGTGE